jgi:hypothetical protein
MEEISGALKGQGESLSESPGASPAQCAKHANTIENTNKQRRNMAKGKPQIITE